MSRFCSDFSVSIFVLSRPRAAVKRDLPSPSRNSRRWSDAGCHRFTGRVTTSNPVTPRDLFLLSSFLLFFALSSSLVLFFLETIRAILCVSSFSQLLLQCDLDLQSLYPYLGFDEIVFNQSKKRYFRVVQFSHVKVYTRR